MEHEGPNSRNGDVAARIVEDDGRWAELSVWLPVGTSVVFDAVATGEGISSWFVPCALEPHVGGRVVLFADPGAPDPTDGPEAAVEASLSATLGEITEYTPPTAGAPGRFAYVERGWMGEGVPVPDWVTGCVAEPSDDGPERPGTLLTLRSGFASDGTLQETAVADSLGGWSHALHAVAHRLWHRPSAGVVTVLAATDPLPLSVADLWARARDTLTGADRVGDAGGDSGGRVVRSGEVSGSVVVTGEAEATVTLSGPCDGVLEIFAFPSGDSADDAASHAALAVRVYEYRDDDHEGPLGAAAVDAEPTWDAPRWRSWLETVATNPT